MSYGFDSDLQDTAFLEGRELRISVPLSITAATPVVLKFTTSRDFYLTSQGLTCDAEGILFEAFRSTQGVEGGTFGTAVPIYSNNFTKSTRAHTPSTLITTGGTFTPNGGQTSVETVRLRTAGATAQASTVGGVVQGRRGLAAGTYYLKFANLTGSGTALGVYSLRFEEL